MNKLSRKFGHALAILGTMATLATPLWAGDRRDNSNRDNDSRPNHRQENPRPAQRESRPAPAQRNDNRRSEAPRRESRQESPRREAPQRENRQDSPRHENRREQPAPQRPHNFQRPETPRREQPAVRHEDRRREDPRHDNRPNTSRHFPTTPRVDNRDQRHDNNRQNNSPRRWDAQRRPMVPHRAFERYDWNNRRPAGPGFHRDHFRRQHRPLPSYFRHYHHGFYPRWNVWVDLNSYGYEQEYFVRQELAFATIMESEDAKNTITDWVSQAYGIPEDTSSLMAKRAAREACEENGVRMANTSDYAMLGAAALAQENLTTINESPFLTNFDKAAVGQLVVDFRKILNLAPKGNRLGSAIAERFNTLTAPNQSQNVEVEAP